MDLNSCGECRAIYLEFRATAAAMRKRLLEQPAVDLIGWLKQVNEEECAQMRETSPLWNTWRRLQQHRAATGHSVSMLMPPNLVANSN